MERTPEDTSADREADRAAQEAASIGGPPADPELPEEERPVVEAGGGDAEGFERAENALRENAEHGDGGGNPERDAFGTEPESGASGAVYGEADQVESTEAEDR